MDLIRPHGGELIDLFVPGAERAALQRDAAALPSWDLNARQLCDIELLMNGAFSPLTGFMGKADYARVVREMRLADGTLWPLPVTLDVAEDFAQSTPPGARVALRDPDGVLVGVLEVAETWRPDLKDEAQRVFGTTDASHPAVDYLLNRSGPVYLGGRVLGVEAPPHYDFKALRDTPAELRAKFQKWGWRRVVAFPTRNPMHRAHLEITHRAARAVEANLLIHPVVGLTKPGDIDHYSRVRCYEHLLKRYPGQKATLSLLHLAMRMGGPREALLHAIIRKNYGCTHLIVGRDHAGTGDFYGPYAAQELLATHQDELGIGIVPFEMMVFVQERAQYVPMGEVQEGETVLNISGTEFRRRLQQGLDIEDWFSYPEVVAELRKTHPARKGQGFTVFLTGLSGAGKSTIAKALMVKLLEQGGRSVTLLDGDLVRKNLSSELGFSREHRDINIRRIGYVAREITKAGGVAICAAIAPYRQTRRDVRTAVCECGGFVEVHVATALETCEARDRKGLYAQARAGILKEFTGISDPYEEPEHAEITIATEDCTPDEAAQRIQLKLKALGYL
jgi:sulfate adenylyltransferase